MPSRTDKYTVPTIISGIGGLLIIAPLFFQVPANYATFQVKQQVAASEEVNRDRIAQRKKTAELIQKTGLLPEGRSYRLIDYDDSNKRPRVKSKSLQAYLADEVVHVYDRSNVCIGVIKNRKFTWKGDSKTACNGAPQINSDN